MSESGNRVMHVVDGRHHYVSPGWGSERMGFCERDCPVCRAEKADQRIAELEREREEELQKQLNLAENIAAFTTMWREQVAEARHALLFLAEARGAWTDRVQRAILAARAAREDTK